MIRKKIIGTAALMGMTAIVLGAFGAHALKERLSVEAAATFETGVKYQMYHALFLLFLGLATFLSDRTRKLIWQLVIFGVAFFSGSIYLLATKEITKLDFGVIGIATPIGGTLLIIAWGILFWNIWKDKR